MDQFTYTEIFPLSKDDKTYRLITNDHVESIKWGETSFLKISADGLTRLSKEAFRDINHLLRPTHLQLLANILNDPESSSNDRFVALEMLKNAVIAAEGIFPMCQDTGTAIIMGKKGQQVWTDCNEEEALAHCVYQAYTQNNLRYSQNAPLTMYEEVNTGCNLPAQIELYATQGKEYHFHFIAKGGGSANKSYLFQETKAVLTPEKLIQFITDKMKMLGTAACPPYHLAVVIGGTSAEFNLKTVKLASTGYLDTLPTQGSAGGHAFRDIEIEQQVLSISRQIGIGAQFGGKYFCLDVRVVRLPRHGASCPIGIGVSCSADRQAKAKITQDGIFIEQFETDPSKYLPQPETEADDAVQLDLNQPMTKIRSILSQYPVATRLLLSGPIIVARDIAHAKIQERIDNGEELPDYFKDHIIYYAGPAKTPENHASGSFGPTTAGRMDSYVAGFQKRGGSLVMLAKGNRSSQVTDACKAYGGFYLGSIGGPAARLGRDCITDVKLIEYPELGMEAIYKIEVKNFPAFIIVDDKGNDFFANLL